MSVANYGYNHTPSGNNKLPPTIRVNIKTTKPNLCHFIDLILEINLLDVHIVGNVLLTDLTCERTCKHMPHLRITSVGNVINHLHWNPTFTSIMNLVATRTMKYQQLRRYKYNIFIKIVYDLFLGYPLKSCNPHANSSISIHSLSNRNDLTFKLIIMMYSSMYEILCKI